MPTHLMCNEKHFYFEIVKREISDSNIWFAWVYMIGSQKEAEDYIYSLTFSTVTNFFEVCMYLLFNQIKYLM